MHDRENAKKEEKMRINKAKGFTLIELIIVLVVVGILAAVAMPQFGNVRRNAQINSIKGTVGNVRSALTIAKADNLVDGSNATNDYWPLLAELQNACAPATVANSPLDTVMPDNPFAAGGPDNSIASRSEAQAQARTISGGNEGWAYCETNGMFFANSNSDPSGEGNLNENQF